MVGAILVIARIKADSHVKGEHEVRPYNSGHSPSTTTSGSPIGPSSLRNTSGSNCSMFQTPGACHLPVSIMMAPTTAGTPVV